MNKVWEGRIVSDFLGDQTGYTINFIPKINQKFSHLPLLKAFMDIITEKFSEMWIDTNKPLLIHLKFPFWKETEPVEFI